MSEIVDAVAKALEEALMEQGVWMQRDENRCVKAFQIDGHVDLPDLARAALAAQKRFAERNVPTIEYFEGCPVDQLDETAYRRYLAYMRDPQNHLRMAMASPSP